MSGRVHRSVASASSVGSPTRLDLMAERNPEPTSTVYQAPDGRWHGRVTVGWRDDGRSDRRHVQAKTKAEVVQKVRALERERDAGRLRKPGTSWTVQAWLKHSLENVAGPNLHPPATRHTGLQLIRTSSPRSDRNGSTGCNRNTWRRSTTDDRRGTCAADSHTRCTERSGQPSARRPGAGTFHATPALAKTPRVDITPVEPLNLDEVRRILAVAEPRRNGARWAIALALGLRQGEALALRWKDVNLDDGTLMVGSTRLRPRYEHGCSGDCGHTLAGTPDAFRSGERRGHQVTGRPANRWAPCRAGSDPPSAPNRPSGRA